MKKNILIFGLVISIIICVNGVLMARMCYNNPDMEGNMLLGYATMIVEFSLIFFAVRNYRNKELNGFISFGKAFKMGAIIAVLAATVYVVCWMVYYYNFVPDWVDVYSQHVLKATPANELAAKTKEMADFKEMYKNPLFVVLMTYAEVLPVALLITLITALILQKKPKATPALAD